MQDRLVYGSVFTMFLLSAVLGEKEVNERVLQYGFAVLLLRFSSLSSSFRYSEDICVQKLFLLFKC